MGRMLDALKTLDSRQAAQRQEAPAAPPPQPQWDAVVEDPAAVLDAPSRADLDDAIETVPPPPKPQQSTAAFETCALPTTADVPDYYLELAAGVNETLASNYCNVLLFVAADRWVEPCFSMTHLAQAFTLRSPGDVLLVDGDVHHARLSRMVARPAPGLIEAMAGQAHWPDIIHPTNMPRIDFVACGSGPVPTVERSEFGWGALRPLYRTVLIGLADPSEPETNWLAARCDAVYLVLSRPHTRRSGATAAVNSLREAGANLIGCVVVND